MWTSSLDELEFHVSGFIVKVNGVWTEKALDQFRHFLKLPYYVISMQRVAAG